MSTYAAARSVMVVAVVNPHGDGRAAARKAESFIELHGSSVGEKNLLMESRVLPNKHPNQLGANTAALVIGVNEEMREVDNEVPVGNGVAETDERVVMPCGDECV